MSRNKEMAMIESVLFLENEPMEERQIGKILGLPVERVRRVLQEIETHYKSEEHGLELLKRAGGWMFSPKEELWTVLKEHYGKKNEEKLSRAAMETLSIIAYSQPITRSEVENIRGVGVTGILRMLMDKELVQEVGKKDAPGRPPQYGTTRQFLHVFQLKSIADLPKLDEVERERFKLNG